MSPTLLLAGQPAAKAGPACRDTSAGGQVLPATPSSFWAAPEGRDWVRHPRARRKGPLPADHLPVPVHRDVGPGPVVIRSKVTVGGSKPLIKSVLQGVELRPVAQMPRNRNPGHFRESHMGTPQSSKQQRSVTFTEYLMKQMPPSTQSVLSPRTERPCPQGDVRTACPPPAMRPGYS